MSPRRKSRERMWETFHVGKITNELSLHRKLVTIRLRVIRNLMALFRTAVFFFAFALNRAIACYLPHSKYRYLYEVFTSWHHDFFFTVFRTPLARARRTQQVGMKMTRILRDSALRRRPLERGFLEIYTYTSRTFVRNVMSWIFPREGSPLALARASQRNRGK